MTGTITFALLDPFARVTVPVLAITASVAPDADRTSAPFPILTVPAFAWVVGSNAAYMTSSERPFTLEGETLAWCCTWAVIFTAVIAAITGSVRAWQLRQ
ncbi:hypothetical protein OM076_09300 [Solirubrobacter ginsenosidimutans]|uniref:Uncharacterized protein n=1 Tax=Solirubrobacter ginsenosidimutans TaxID=490573 RepID=A0A9X3MPJ3_9ACTN|nr:hypothetical protein [Solirubrobacter ginsenosidimutans]MDA0160461.1 hypothetical protein [Solirubrobacter ginsenosidimutans]